MICTQCGTENSDDANFCGSCGSSIGSAFDSPAGPVTSLGGHDEGEESASEISEEGAVVGSVELEPPPGVEAPEPLPEPVKEIKPPNFSEPVPIPTHMPEPPPPTKPTPPANPNHPGAGLAPPPPPPAGSYSQPQAQQGYGYSMPADGNTSGMGESYPVPPEAEGWSFAGFIPLGLFSFINGNTLWGIIWWVTWFFSVNIVYWIYVGMFGKKQAWQGRRFDSMQQYVDTMRAWNTWGIVLVAFVIGVSILVVLFWVGIFMAVLSEEMANPSGY